MQVINEKGSANKSFNTLVTPLTRKQSSAWIMRRLSKLGKEQKICGNRDIPTRFSGVAIFRKAFSLIIIIPQASDT